jgi:hypothetical protein
LVHVLPRPGLAKAAVSSRPDARQPFSRRGERPPWHQRGLGGKLRDANADGVDRATLAALARPAGVVFAGVRPVGPAMNELADYRVR